jgi:hypothetical protein
MNRLTTREDCEDEFAGLKSAVELVSSSSVCPVLDLSVKTQTWPVDSRGLLHDRGSAVSMREFRVRVQGGSFVLSRDKTETELTSAEEISDFSENLFRLESPGNISSSFRLDSSLDLWENVGETLIDLKTGDIIRMGSLKLRLAEYCRASEAGSTYALSPLREAATQQQPGTLGGEGETNEEEERTCRVCFESDESERNKLLAACMCKGSVRLIHSECLMHWVDGQLLIRRIPDDGGCYALKPLQCELCKYPYSHDIYKNIFIKRPLLPHLVLEELDATSTTVTRLHVVPIAKKFLTFGRSKECDVWLADITVSRRHAKLHIVNNELLKMEDIGSKFGTLVRLPSSVLLTKKTTQIQVTNSLVTIRISPPSRIAAFLIPRRFQPAIGKIRVSGSSTQDRSPERGQRNLTIINQVVSDDPPDESSTVFRGSPTHHARLLSIENEDPPLSRM